MKNTDSFEKIRKISCFFRLDMVQYKSMNTGASDVGVIQLPEPEHENIGG